MKLISCALLFAGISGEDGEDAGSLLQLARHKLNTNKSKHVCQCLDRSSCSDPLLDENGDVIDTPGHEGEACEAEQHACADAEEPWNPGWFDRVFSSARRRRWSGDACIKKKPTECQPGKEKEFPPGVGGCQKCICDDDGTWACEPIERRRKDYHDLTDFEKKRFVDAVNKLRGQKVDGISPTAKEWIIIGHGTQGHGTPIPGMSSPDKLGCDPRSISPYQGNMWCQRKVAYSNKWKMIAVKHYEAEDYAHRKPAFLPWHRRFILDAETMLQEAAGSCYLTYPYWNWAYEMGSAATSSIFGSGPLDLGKMLQEDQQVHDITDGFFAGSNFQADPDDPNFGFVQRRGSFNLAPMDYPSVLNFLTDPDKWTGDDIAEHFERMRLKVENTFHNSVHGAIRGQMGAFFSPYDPIFFMHHGFIDFLWHRWQEKNVKVEQQGHRDHDKVVRIMQKEPRARQSGMLPPGAEKFSDTIPASYMANAKHLQDDNPATVRTEYARVVWDEVQYSNDPNDACGKDRWKINVCLRTLYEMGHVHKVPRIDTDHCNPASDSQAKHEKIWLDMLVKGGHITAEEEQEGLKTHQDAIKDLEAHFPAPVSSNDKCDLSVCFSVSTMLSLCPHLQN